MTNNGGMITQIISFDGILCNFPCNIIKVYLCGKIPPKIFKWRKKTGYKII
jgi:hypothetical protein